MRHSKKKKKKPNQTKPNHGKQTPGIDRHIDVQNRQTDKGREQQHGEQQPERKVGTLLLKETICHGS
jgi:hypothetical protein